MLPTSRPTRPRRRPAIRRDPAAGDHEATATTTLENAGFTVNVVREDTTDSSEDGPVLDETPAGGTDAKRGAKVTITIGSLASG